MLISYNELQTNCYKAFFGLHSSGEADKVASIVATNEIIGLHGIKHFTKALKHSSNNNAVIHIKQNNNVLYCDLQNCSILNHINILLDSTIETLRHYDKVELTIDNCYNRWFIVGALFSIKKINNTAIIAKWVDNDNEVLCFFEHESDYPNIYNSVHKNNSAKDKSIKIIIGKNITITEKYSEKYSAQHLRKQHLQNTINGISVDDNDFAIITTFAQAILAEETVQSHKDAGE